MTLAQTAKAEGETALKPVSSGIVCGTDFSGTSQKAVEVAAMIARRAGEKLTLVHAMQGDERTSLPGDLVDSLALYAHAELLAEQARVREMGVEQTEAFRVGSPADVLLHEARVRKARLLTLAATPKNRLRNLLRGSIAEQVAEKCEVPTLLIRDAESLLRWERNGRRLRVVVNADWLSASKGTLRWLKWLRTIGPCELILIYLEPQLMNYLAVDLIPSVLEEELLDEMALSHARRFRREVRNILGNEGVRIRFEKGWGLSDAHLIEVAKEERADLVVVGRLMGGGLKRHPLTHGVLHYAPMNVVCVPEWERESLRSVLSLQTKTQAQAIP